MKTSSTRKIQALTIWLVEDNEMFRKNIAAFLRQTPEWSCEKSFDSCESLLEHLDGHAGPEVILMDINLPGMSGLDGLKRVTKIAANTKVVILTAFDDNDKIFEAICSGAAGYLLKSGDPERIVADLRDIVDGGAPMNSHIARKVLAMFTAMAAPKADYSLTARENDVLRLLVEGLPKRKIADRLFITFHTVDMHMRNIYGKMHVNSRSSAVAKAVRERL